MVFTKADNGIVLNFGWDKVRVAVPFITLFFRLDEKWLPN
jgi:hypothetical protein